MKIILQIGIVFCVCLVGEAISRMLPFHFPASITGMVLLFLLLCGSIIKTEHIQKKGDFLLKNMAFFFIPAGVALMDNYEMMEHSAWQIIVICVISTLLTFTATAYTIIGVVALQSRISGRGK